MKPAKENSKPKQFKAPHLQEAPRPKEAPRPQSDNLVALAEQGEWTDRMLNHPVFRGILNQYLQGLDSGLMKLRPEDKDSFAGIVHKKDGIFELVNIMQRVVSRGKEARVKLRPGFTEKEAKGHAL